MLRAIEDPVIPGWRKRAVYAAAFVPILLPAVVLEAFHLDLPSLGAYHDDGVYLVTAKAIAQGKGYRIESLPDERWQTKYPPVFPVALAVIWRLSSLHFAENLGGFLIVAWLALPALLLLQARMLARLEFRLSSQVVARLCIPAYQSTLQLSVTLLSDLWFCCEILFAVWLAERASEPDAHWKFSAAAGLAAALVYLTKSAGIVLFPSIAGVMVSRGRWRHALVFCAIFGPAVATWRAWSVTYLHPVADYNDVFYSSNLQEFTYKQALEVCFPTSPAPRESSLCCSASALIPEFLSGVVFDWLRLLAGILGVVGVVLLCRSGRVWHYAAFAALYALEMCVWPTG